MPQSNHLAWRTRRRAADVTAAAALIAGALLAGAPRAGASADALNRMVEAERAFARAASERGIRAAFLTFLADNAISLQPYGNAKEQWRARPAPPAAARQARLEWAPRTGDIAASGDLGWLTGEFTLTPPGDAPRYGCYFSVWQRDERGDWRVRLDVGVSTPEPVTFPAPGFRRVAGPAGRRVDDGASAAPASALVAADRALASDAAARSVATALLAVIDEEARLHREGLQPLAGRASIARYLASAPPPAQRFAPAIESGVAASGDLGWTIGRYAPAAGPGESGYYLRVWKRDGTGRWTIAADIAQPGTP